MTIETRIDGNPASIRANADWLRVQLADRLDRSVTDMFSSRDDATERMARFGRANLRRPDGHDRP